MDCSKFLLKSYPLKALPDTIFKMVAYITIPLLCFEKNFVTCHYIFFFNIKMSTPSQVLYLPCSIPYKTGTVTILTKLRNRTTALITWWWYTHQALVITRRPKQHCSKEPLCQLQSRSEGIGSPVIMILQCFSTEVWTF